MTNRLASEEIAARVLEDSLVDGGYTTHYQPPYTDTDALLEAVHELHATEPVTTPRQIDRVQRQLTGIALGDVEGPVIITESCAEDVDLSQPIGELVRPAVNSRELVLSVFPGAVVFQRNRGQGGKPRTSAQETLPDGTVVISYMGDMVNSRDPANRTPDPTRLVAGAVQARDLEAGLTAAVGEHVPAAHEALLLPYDGSFIAIDEQTGKEYMLSTDLPWAGKRTNRPDGKHVEMLSRVENPVGIKLGAESSPEHIAKLVDRLNPDRIPGKLVIMLRMQLGDTDALRSVVAGLREHAAESVFLQDIHGITRTAANGEKIRYVGDIEEDVKDKASVLGEFGLRLHGVHWETMHDNSRLECVDYPDQLPTHPGNVDPRLNPRQTKELFERVKAVLSQA